MDSIISERGYCNLGTVRHLIRNCEKPPSVVFKEHGAVQTINEVIQMIQMPENDISSGIVRAFQKLIIYQRTDMIQDTNHYVGRGQMVTESVTSFFFERLKTGEENFRYLRQLNTSNKAYGV